MTRSLLAATLLLASLWAGLSAAAQDAGREEGGSVAFELTIHGDPPEDATFQVGIGQCPGGSCALEARMITFCGQDPDWPGQAGGPPCEGGGRTYTASVSVPPGIHIRFDFVRTYPDGGTETFGRTDGIRIVPPGGTYSASYTFPGAEATASRDGEMPARAPDSGAGRAEGAGSPRIAMAAVAVVASAIGGYAALRRRRVRARSGG